MKQVHHKILRGFFALFLLVNLIAGTAKGAQFTWNSTGSTTWSTNLGGGEGTVYTLNSGNIPIDPTIVLFRNAPANASQLSVNVDNNYNLQFLSFYQTPFYSGSGYTLSGAGSLIFTPTTANNSGNSGVLLSASFNSGTNINEQINVPIYLSGTTQTTVNSTTTNTSGGEVIFANDSIYTQGNTLTFGTTAAPSTISGLQETWGNDPVSLLLFGLGNGTINDNIIDGANLSGSSNTAVLSLNVVSAATWTLTGTNTYSGPTLVTGGGTLVLNDTYSNTSKINTSSLTVGGIFTNTTGTPQSYAGGSTVELIGNATGASTQTVANTTFGLGANTIEVVTGTNQTATFNLGSISLSTATSPAGGTIYGGGTVNFQLINTGTGVATINASLNSSVTPNNYLLGGWATLNGTDWANLNSSGNVVAASYVNDTFATANNVNVTKTESVGSANANAITNSLRFATAAPITLTLSSTKNNSINSGGILVASSVGANNITITGTKPLLSGYDSTGSGNNEYFIQQFDTQNVLSIQSNLTSPILNLSGGGTLNLSGNDSMSVINIDAGTLQVGSSNAFNGAPSVYLGGSSAILDLHGNNATVSNLYSYNLIQGAEGQGSGLTPLVENAVAGTISTLSITAADASTSTFDGDFYETPGAVLNINKTAGNATVVIVGGWNNNSQEATASANGNLLDGALAAGVYDLINGGLTIGDASDYGGAVSIGNDFYMLGAVYDYGVLGAYNNNTGGFGQTSTTYLTGNGSYAGQKRSGLYVNLGGSSVADTFSGSYTGNLIINGAGTFNLSSAQTATGVSGLVGGGTAIIVTPGLTTATGNSDSATLATISPMGQSIIKLTGTSGVVAGVGESISNGPAANIGFAGGTLWIAPTLQSSSTAISVSGNTAVNAILEYGSASDYIGNNMAGNGTLLLDRNGNQSLTFTIGNTSDAAAEFSRVNKGTLVIAATDGLSGLGGTEKFVVLGSNSTALPAITNGMVSASIVGAAGTSTSLGQGTFLTYSGTGATTDTGFTGVTYDDTNFTATTTNATKEWVTSAKSIAGANVYALRDDNTLTNTGTLTIGNASTTVPAGLILNNGTIAGAGTLSSGASELAIYTYGSSTINNNLTSATTGGLTLFGPGTLYLKGTIAYTGTTTLNSGVLDIGAVSNFATTSNLSLQGGVLEATGTFTRNVGTASNQFQLSNGGFAASSSSGLLLEFNSNSSTAILWGGNDISGNTNFMTDGGVLELGSATALGVVNLQSNIALGATYGGYDTTTQAFSAGSSTALYRNIGVTDNTSTYADYGQISGILSSGGDYRGIEKSGNGLLYLSGVNTYTGPTAISAGTLAINSDSSLGTAPTAAYAITGTVTMGAVQIDGGATLLDWATGSTTLNANRTVLLGGGSASGLAVITGGTLTVAGSIGDSINGPGSLDINPTTGLGYNAATTQGTVILTGNGNTYSGGTTVETGTTLFVNNTLSTSSGTGAGSLTIMSGGKLRGTGYIAPSTSNSDTIVGVTINANANLAPGTTSGSNVASGFLTLQPTYTNGFTSFTGALLTVATPTSTSNPAQLSFNLGNGTNGITGAGQVVNGLTLAGSSTYISLPTDSAGEVIFSLNPSTPTLIQLSDLTSGALASGNYLLFAAQSDSDYLFGSTTLSNGAITSGLAIASGFTGGTASLYLQNGDIYASVVSSAPEPSTWALLVLGFVLVPIYRLRKAVRG